MIPQISDPNYRTTLEVRVDGVTRSTLDLGIGEWEITAQIPSSNTPRIVDLSFSAVQALPPPDWRQAAAFLREIGLFSSIPGEANETKMTLNKTHIPRITS